MTNQRWMSLQLLDFFTPSNIRSKRGGKLEMRTLLELLRIIIIFVLLGGLGGAILRKIYTINEVTGNYSWLGSLAIFVILFVLYRNKLQFSGWYEGKGRKKLPEKVTITLIFTSIILIIAPFILDNY